jgi:hypothetical protein
MDTILNDHHQLIEAFADGEPVDPTALADALASRDAREHLADVLTLRGLVGGHTATWTPVVVEAHPVARGRWLAAIAATLVAGLIGGFAAGRQSGPAATAAPPVAITSSDPTPGAVPVPTHIIRLEPGVDWSERGTGGN